MTNSRALSLIAAMLVGRCVRWPGAAAINAPCNVQWVSDSLRVLPNDKLSGLDRFAGRISTPFKSRGVSGWSITRCFARGTGALIYDAAHSTDGFWTLDVQLTALTVNETRLPLARTRYLRLEVEPDTHAHEIVDARPPMAGSTVSFAGVIVVDHDGVGFFEVHPSDEFAMSKP